MEAGQLKQRITIQKPANGYDALGQPLKGWEDVCTTWAAVEPLSGREYFNAQMLTAQVETRIRMRWRDGIDHTMRVLHAGKVYNIQSVIDPKSARRELQLMCKGG